MRGWCWENTTGGKGVERPALSRHYGSFQVLGWQGQAGYQ